jgi:hypothetical protein
MAHRNRTSLAGGRSTRASTNTRPRASAARAERAGGARAEHRTADRANRSGSAGVTYRLNLADGSDAGEATYAQLIHVGEEIIGADAQRLRVLDVVPFDEEDESQFVGLLQVEAF